MSNAVGHGNPAPRGALRATGWLNGTRRQKRRATRRAGTSRPAKRLPLLAVADVHPAACSASICSGVIRPAWLSLCAGERQPVSLDRVGDETGRHGRRRRAWNASRTVSRSWPAEVGHQRVQSRIVVVLVEQLAGSRRRVAEIASRAAPRQAAPPWYASAEYRVFGHASIHSRSASPPRRGERRLAAAARTSA